MKYKFVVTKNIEKYRIEKLIFIYIVSAEKNLFLAKSDRDRLGLQIPRSAVSVKHLLGYSKICVGPCIMGLLLKKY